MIIYIWIFFYQKDNFFRLRIIIVGLVGLILNFLISLTIRLSDVVGDNIIITPHAMLDMKMSWNCVKEDLSL